MLYAEAIGRIYQERAQSSNWAAWASQNPEKAAVLNEAGTLAKWQMNQ